MEMDMYEFEKTVETKEDFVLFLSMLREDFISFLSDLETNKNEWENGWGNEWENGWENITLDSFLSAIQRFCEDAGADVPSWKNFATLFSAPKVYE